MALVKVLTQEAQYKEDYFQKMISNVVGENGVLSGFSVKEKLSGGQVFSVLSPGSFISNNKIYIFDKEIDGSLDFTHDLEVTQFADDPAFMMTNTLLYSGRESIYLVETATLSGGEPHFAVKLLVEAGDIVISQRKVDWYVREDADPLSYDVLVSEPGDGNTAVVGVPTGLFLISGPSDICALKIGSDLDVGFNLLIE